MTDDLERWEGERRAVKDYLSMPGYVVHRGLQRVFEGMGDRAGTAILRAIYGSETFEDELIRKIVQIVLSAFYNPENVRYEADRQPAVTLCMLEWVISKKPDAEEIIRPVIREIEKKL